MIGLNIKKIQDPSAKTEVLLTYNLRKCYFRIHKLLSHFVLNFQSMLSTKKAVFLSTKKY